MNHKAITVTVTLVDDTDLAPVTLQSRDVLTEMLNQAHTVTGMLAVGGGVMVPLYQVKQVLVADA